MTTSTRAGRDEAQILQLITEQEAAMRAGDADTLVARYAPDAVKFSLAPPLRSTGPAVRDAQAVRGWLATFDGPVDYEVRDLRVTAGEDVAFCHSLNRLSAIPRGTTERFDLWFRATVCLRKTDDTWWISHEHLSTPFYMDGSFGAALDLQP